ncbi:MAG: hypothetical protein LC770_06865, partial [Acidobacteria bacterium]|nr:hypothetical protein [Acidobacteriota bacterium]
PYRTPTPFSVVSALFELRVRAIFAHGTRQTSKGSDKTPHSAAESLTSYRAMPDDLNRSIFLYGDGRSLSSYHGVASDLRQNGIRKHEAKDECVKTIGS